MIKQDEKKLGVTRKYHEHVAGLGGMGMGKMKGLGDEQMDSCYGTYGSRFIHDTG